MSSVAVHVLLSNYLWNSRQLIMTLSCLKSPLLCTLYTNLSHLTTTLFFMCYFVYSLRVMMCVCRILIKITYLALLIGPAEKLSHIFSSAIFNSETVLGFGSRFQNSFASSSRDKISPFHSNSESCYGLRLAAVGCTLRWKLGAKINKQLQLLFGRVPILIAFGNRCRRSKELTLTPLSGTQKVVLNRKRLLQAYVFTLLFPHINSQ